MSATLVLMTTAEFPTLHNGYYACVAPEVALGDSPRQQGVTIHNVSPTGRFKGSKGLLFLGVQGVFPAQRSSSPQGMCAA